MQIDRRCVPRFSSLFLVPVDRRKTAGPGAAEASDSEVAGREPTLGQQPKRTRAVQLRNPVRLAKRWCWYGGEQQRGYSVPAAHSSAAVGRGRAATEQRERNPSAKSTKF